MKGERGTSGKSGRGPGRTKRGPGRPRTPKWKIQWREYEKAQDALKPKEQKTFHQTIERQGLPSTTKTVEFPGGKELDVKVTKP